MPTKMLTFFKRILPLIALAITLATLTGCSSYECSKCHKTTMQAYYDINMSKDYVLCNDCAHSYWGILFSEDYRV